MRYAAFAATLALIVLEAFARDRGWIVLPDVARQGLLLALPLAWIPLYLEGLREGELVVPPSTIRRRLTPRLFWFVAALEAIVILALVLFLGGDLVNALVPR